MGRANERIGSIQDAYMASATSHWLEGLERSLATMKEYQVSSCRQQPLACVKAQTSD